eukprot:UN26203
MKVKSVVSNIIVFVFIIYDIYSSSDAKSNFFWNNFIIQTILFTVVAVIPCLMTQKMMWVDIAWPWGVFILSLQAFWNGQGYWLRKMIICFIYGFIGFRMGFGGLFIIPWRRKDYPRYEYAKMRFERKMENVHVSMVYDIYMQAFANVYPLWFPICNLCMDTRDHFNIAEILCVMGWVIFYIFESIADGQKQIFSSLKTKDEKRNKVCRVGLWNISRHPNYFGQWMQWVFIGV